MLAEFFQALCKHAQSGLTPAITNVGDVRILTHANGATQTFLPHSHTKLRADCIDSFQRLATRAPESAPVYVGDDLAQLVRVDPDTDLIVGQLRMELCTTALFSQLADVQSMDPKTAVRWLRLAACAPQGVIDAMRRVDFTRRSDGSHTNDRQKESLGRSVEAAVQGRDDIPEDMELSVQVWEGIDVFVSLRVLIDFDLQNQTILFAVRDRDYSAAHLWAKRALGDRLVDGTDRDYVLGDVRTEPRYA